MKTRISILAALLIMTAAVSCTKEQTTPVSPAAEPSAQVLKVNPEGSYVVLSTEALTIPADGEWHSARVFTCDPTGYNPDVEYLISYDPDEAADASLLVGTYNGKIKGNSTLCVTSTYNGAEPKTVTVDFISEPDPETGEYQVLGSTVITVMPASKEADESGLFELEICPNVYGDIKDRLTENWKAMRKSWTANYFDGPWGKPKGTVQMIFHANVGTLSNLTFAHTVSFEITPEYTGKDDIWISDTATPDYGENYGGYAISMDQLSRISENGQLRVEIFEVEVNWVLPYADTDMYEPLKKIASAIIGDTYTVQYSKESSTRVDFWESNCSGFRAMPVKNPAISIYTYSISEGDYIELSVKAD